MSRHILSLSHEQLTAFALDAFVAHAEARNRHNRAVFTIPFPKAPRRWLSHYQFTPRPITLTREGDVDGGRSGLLGATLDFSFARALCAPPDGARGGSCYAPARLVLLEVAAPVDHYVDSAHFCHDLQQSDKGRRSRELAGLHNALPGEDDLCHFRSRVGDDVIHKTLAVVVELLRRFRLITGELLSTAGQLEPSYSRDKGCTYACESCRAFRVDEAGQQERRRQVQSGAKRLQRTCPFPDVVAKGREAPAKQGHPTAPKGSRLELEEVSDAAASHSDRPQVATLLDLPEAEVPPVRRQGCHVHQGAEGALWGRCPKVPSALEAKVGSHLDTPEPSQKDAVFGYVHLKTTDRNGELGLELPVGTSTYAADAKEGTHFIAHRQHLAGPVSKGQGQLGDAAYEVIANSEWLHDHGGIAVFASNRRHEHLDPASLVNRGYDQDGTP
jgi:hypothetical protein